MKSTPSPKTAKDGIRTANPHANSAAARYFRKRICLLLPY
jgi:hypothetical protein